MKDPYSVLGIPRTATDEEIKKAYRDLARKYHPDNYQNSSLADLASEKMKEINESYDTIQRERMGKGSSSGSSYSSNNGSSGSSFAEARVLINSGRYAEAEIILNSQDPQCSFSFSENVIYPHQAPPSQSQCPSPRHFSTSSNYGRCPASAPSAACLSSFSKHILEP